MAGVPTWDDAVRESTAIRANSSMDSQAAGSPMRAIVMNSASSHVTAAPTINHIACQKRAIV